MNKSGNESGHGRVNERTPRARGWLAILLAAAVAVSAISAMMIVAHPGQPTGQAPPVPPFKLENVVGYTEVTLSTAVGGSQLLTSSLVTLPANEYIAAVTVSLNCGYSPACQIAPHGRYYIQVTRNGEGFLWAGYVTSDGNVYAGGSGWSAPNVQTNLTNSGPGVLLINAYLGTQTPATSSSFPLSFLVWVFYSSSTDNNPTFVHVEQPFTGLGEVVRASPVNPGTGVPWTLNVPSYVRWQWAWFEAGLTTSSTTGNRQLQFGAYKDTTSGIPAWAADANVLQPSKTTWYYHFTRLGFDTSVAPPSTGGVSVGLPDTLASPGMEMFCWGAGLQTTDQLFNINYGLQEWAGPNA